jgi:outer membrane receptor protein involved in Fe transport
MKKLITALAITGSLCSSSYAGDFVDYYGLGVALQSGDSNNFDNGTALVFNSGKGLGYDLGLEFEGTFSIAKPEGKLGTVKSDLDFWSVGMYGTYMWKLGNLSIKPRVGLIYEYLKSDLNIHSETNEPAGTDKSDVALSAGVGFAYNLSERYNIFTNYTRMEDDISHLTFGAEFKF